MKKDLENDVIRDIWSQITHDKKILLYNKKKTIYWVSYVEDVYSLEWIVWEVIDSEWTIISYIDSYSWSDNMWNSWIRFRLRHKKWNWNTVEEAKENEKKDYLEEIEKIDRKIKELEERKEVYVGVYNKIDSYKLRGE